jgi:outer membrane protein assembly factor BamD (BamD/ComL family)
MDTEASGPAFGPEFFEVEKLLTDSDEVEFYRLRLWNRPDSCTDQSTVDEGIAELTKFTKQFPNSSHLSDIKSLLNEYSQGLETCR